MGLSFVLSYSRGSMNVILILIVISIEVKAVKNIFCFYGVSIIIRHVFVGLSSSYKYFNIACHLIL